MDLNVVRYKMDSGRGTIMDSVLVRLDSKKFIINGMDWRSFQLNYSTVGTVRGMWMCLQETEPPLETITNTHTHSSQTAANKSTSLIGHLSCLRTTGLVVVEVTWPSIAVGSGLLMLVKFITGNQVLLGKAFSISIPLLNLVIMGKQIKKEKRK